MIVIEMEYYTKAKWIFLLKPYAFWQDIFLSVLNNQKCKNKLIINTKNAPVWADFVSAVT